MQIARRNGTKGLRPPRVNNPFIPPKGGISFINNLPVELLSHIFQFASMDDDGFCEEDDAVGNYWHNIEVLRLQAKGLLRDEDEGDFETTDDEGPSVHLPPTIPFQVFISHVCHHWRNVALSTPSLWDTVEVFPVAGLSYELESALLERSQDIPVNIRVGCLAPQDSPKAPSNTEVRSLFSKLTPHIHRWRTLEVTVPDYDFMFMFLSAVSNPSIPAASQLTSIKLYCDTGEEPGEFDSFRYPSMSKHFTTFNGSAPLLTKIVLWKVHVDWDQPWISSAPNLANLELAFHTDDVRPSWTQFATMLRGATALQKLTLRRSGPSGDPTKWFIEQTPGCPADLNAPVNLPQLKDLVLTSHLQARVIGLLRRLYLPSLTNMVLILTDGDYTDLVHQISGPATSPFLPSIREQPRSLMSKLESLRIILPCRPSCVEALYDELQNVTSLNISLWAVPSLFLEILGTRCKLPGRGDVWLPCLDTLYICGATGDAIREVVQSRIDAGLPLSSLHVEESCEIDEEDLNWLQRNLNTFKRTWDS